MNRRAVLAILFLGAVACPCLPMSSLGLRSVGLRVILPFTGIPISIGAEVVTEASFGGLSLSLFLSPRGGTLLLGSAEIALTGDPEAASAFLRLTTGLSYFDSSRLLPSLLFGGGVSVLFTAAEPFTFAMAAETIYPLAFPIPMLTLSGAWSLP